MQKHQHIDYKLPTLWRGKEIHFGYREPRVIYFQYNTYLWQLQISKPFVRWAPIATAFLVVIGVSQLLRSGGNEPQLQASVPVVQVKNDSEAAPLDVVGTAYEYFDKIAATPLENHSIRENFMVKRQVLVSEVLINAKVARLDQLPDVQLLELNKRISDLYLSEVLGKLKIHEHVNQYFTDTTDLKKIETALVEQAKFHVPASIKLAQSALETSYGRRIIHNNYFGIKDKQNATPSSKTVEYYTAAEAKLNKSKILTKEKVNVGGRTLYKCLVVDHFSRYNTPWESFRSHSKFLANNKRYNPLFTKGKNYEDWAEKIGSTKYGGVGYATSPVYGELLKKIIRRYHLDLLDY